MQKEYIGKNNKHVLYILFLFVMIYIFFSFNSFTEIKSYGKTYTYTKKSNDLAKDFENTYPGYEKLLKKLVEDNPDWTFKLYETGLDWETVINSEYQGHGSSPKNLVPSNYSARLDMFNM